MPNKKLSLLILGTPNRTEMNAVLDATTKCDVSLHIFKDISFFLNQENSSEKTENLPSRPDLVLILQNTLGEISQKNIWTLRKRMPLSPLILILGSWCEGASRTGPILRGVHPVYWYHWITHCSREIAQLAAGHPSIWSLPEADPALGFILEATRHEVFPSGSIKLAQTPSRLIYLIMEDNAMVRFWEDALSMAGFTVCSLSSATSVPTTQPHAIFMEITGITPFTEKIVPRSARCYPHAIRVAICDFPRIHEITALKELGITHYFAQPARLGDVIHILNEKKPPCIGISPETSFHNACMNP